MCVTEKESASASGITPPSLDGNVKAGRGSEKWHAEAVVRSIYLAY